MAAGIVQTMSWLRFAAVAVSGVGFGMDDFEFRSTDYYLFLIPAENNQTQKLCSDLNCMYNCKQTPAGPKCYCAAGYQPNGTRCEDVNECLLRTHNCAQLCHNTDGSFRCSCTAGYETAPSGFCRAVNVPKDDPGALVFFDTRGIWRYRFDSAAGKATNRTTAAAVGPELIYADTGIQSIEMSHRNRSICAIGTHMNGTVLCMEIDGPEKRSEWQMPLPDLFETAESGFVQLRLDWTSGNWYFMNRAEDLIVVCNEAVHFCKIIVETVDQRLQSMALDPTKG